jgi:hypothetical protein
MSIKSQNETQTLHYKSLSSTKNIQFLGVGAS